MTNTIAVINRLYSKHGPLARRFVMALAIILGINMAFPGYQGYFPQAWGRLADVILVSALLINLKLGYLFLLLLTLGLVIWTMPPYGSGIILLWVLSAKVMYWLVDVLFRLIGIREANASVTGTGDVAERLFMLLNPILAFAHVGYFIPIYAASRFGWRGVRTAVAATMATSLVLVSFGYTFWGISTKDLGLPTVFSTPIQSLKGATFADYLVKHAALKKGPALMKYCLDFQELGVFGQAVWAVVRPALSGAILIAQVILLGGCAAVVAIKKGRNNTNMVPSILIGTGVLVAGYALLPLVLSPGKGLSLPGGGYGFALTLGSSLAMVFISALLPDPGPSFESAQTASGGSRAGTDANPRVMLDPTSGIGSGSQGSGPSGATSPGQGSPGTEGSPRAGDDAGRTPPQAGGPSEGGQGQSKKKIRIEL